MFISIIMLAMIKKVVLACIGGILYSKSPF